MLPSTLATKILQLEHTLSAASFLHYISPSEGIKGPQPTWANDAPWWPKCLLSAPCIYALYIHCLHLAADYHFTNSGLVHNHPYFTSLWSS